MPELVPAPRRKRMRARGFDYSSHGSYFVTIDVDQMEHRFGRVINGQVQLNEAGQLIDQCWTSLPDRFPSVWLDAHVVMPNHLHGIVFIDHSIPGETASLPSIIGAFKSLSTIAYGRGVKVGRFPSYARALWQRGYFEKIIRHERMLDTERAYIEGNPGRWEERRG